MSQLEDLQPNASLRGVLPNALVTVVNVQWLGSDALDLTYKDPAGKLGSELLYRHDEPRLEIAAVEDRLTKGIEPDFGAASVNCDFVEPLARAEAPW